MNPEQFKAWLRGYLEGVRDGDGEIEDDAVHIIKRIEEEAEKLSAPVDFQITFPQQQPPWPLGPSIWVPTLILNPQVMC